MLFKNVYLHSLNLINFVYAAVFDVNAALENAKLAILERLELRIFFALPNHKSSHPQVFFGKGVLEICDFDKVQ